MTSLTRRVATAATVSLLTVLSLLPGAPAQAAPLTDPGDATRPAFYQAPAQLPAQNGAIIKAEPAPFHLDPLNLRGTLITSQRIMYKTTNRTGTPVGVTGTVITPKTAWSGPGKRPLISFAVGTQGLADQCAPSRLLAFAAEYEEVFVGTLLSRGYAVAITDYEGLGTAGIHTYMDRVSQGRAVLDMARAAISLPGTGLSAQSPIGVDGYSQGGGAAAAAAELAPSYAPELQIKGVSAGAVPADLTAVGTSLDGGLYAEFMLFALDGLFSSYGVDPASFLNAAGQAKAAEVSGHCVWNLPQNSYVKMANLSSSGQSFTQLAQQAPISTMLADQFIGRARPGAPVLITHSVADDVIPYRVGKGLAQRWCTAGTTVNFVPTPVPTHVGGAAPHFAATLAFFEARFRGLPATNNCWTL